jgi:CxxC-x17-CxxC domain-containing protein
VSLPEFVHVETGVRVPICVDCGETFERTPRELASRTDAALPLSARCPACRERRRAELNARRLADYDTGVVGRAPWPAPGPENGGGRLHSATCAACGLRIRLPFRPRGDRPLFCRSCLGARHGQ